ncbi:MAG TPA: ATPase, T2SS/T4P/T4SS family [Tepidisphaeraceae bacterium]|nr:ATPase, T2SS/T4P/T4SS family [Tepidisphaeraceae bacterium]
MQPLTGLIAATEVGGAYISLLKLLPVILLLLIFLRLTTWIDKDAERAHLPREIINSLMFIVGIAGFIIFFFIPSFAIAFSVLFGVIALDVGIYLILRSQQVGLGDLQGEFKQFLRNLGRSKPKVVEAEEGEVQFIKKNNDALEPPDSDDPARAGYDAAQTIISEPLHKNAERIEVRPLDEGMAGVTFLVDGYPYNAPSLNRAAAASAITFLKRLAAMDVNDKRKPQAGTAKVILDGKRSELEVATAGTTAGETLRITVDPKKKSPFTLDNLGFSTEQLKSIRTLLEDNKGIVLVAAPRGQGLTTLLHTILRAHDAFVHHIQTVEHAPKEDLEGITVNKLPANASSAEEFKQVEWVCSQIPDVLLVDEITNPQSARELIKFSREGRRVYLGMRAGTTFEALDQWRKLVGDDKAATDYLRMIIAGRVVRRLCMACKVGYAPDPETLRKLNMDPNRVTQLFQARTQPLRDPKGNPMTCDFCVDLRFKGRFGVYEIFIIDDEVRSAALAGGTLNQLKTIFRKARGRYLQEMALAQVEAGETSVQEVLRVLKGPEQPARAPAVASTE